MAERAGEMIPISCTGGFLIYLFIWIIVVFILWCRELWRRKVYDWALSEGSLCICDDCHYAFLVKPNETVSRCPRCNEICSVKRKKR